MRKRRSFRKLAEATMSAESLARAREMTIEGLADMGGGNFYVTVTGPVTINVNGPLESVMASIDDVKREVGETRAAFETLKTAHVGLKTQVGAHAATIADLQARLAAQSTNDAALTEIVDGLNAVQADMAAAAEAPTPQAPPAGGDVVAG